MWRRSGVARACHHKSDPPRDLSTVHATSKSIDCLTGAADFSFADASGRDRQFDRQRTARHRRRIARVGCNITEIYTITGHKLSEAQPAIPLARDLSRGAEVAAKAIGKLNASEKSQRASAPWARPAARARRPASRRAPRASRSCATRARAVRASLAAAGPPLADAVHQVERIEQGKGGQARR